MVAYESLKTKEKSKSGCGRGRLRELFITKFKSQFKRGFTKVVVTRADCLQERSQGELQ